METEIFRTQDVFVPGAYPSLTFNERVEAGLRLRVVEYLQLGAGHCLLVHGPSKTGKTVLIERWLGPKVAIWIKGNEISKIEDFYARIIDELDLFTEISTSHATTTNVGGTGGLELGVPGFKYRADVSAGADIEERRGQARVAMGVSVVKKALQTKPVPIVIDDLHFMKPALRLEVAQAVKDLIRFTHVVLISIPHSAFEPLKRLDDMDWRVETLEVKHWKTDELAAIAAEGFRLLGVVDHGAVVGTRLATESRGAPAIMQTLCLRYMTRVMNVLQTSDPAQDAKTPEDWSSFFSTVAQGRKPSAFDEFLKGKDVRGMNRAARTLKTGGTTDIYGAVFYTLAKMGANRSITKNELAAKMQELIVDAPTASVISGNLTHLAEIAEKVRGNGDPALTYQDPELQLLDPFLSFYLAHGEWDLPVPSQ